MIETERLFVREWREADRALFAEINADAAVMEHLGGLQDQAQSSAFIDRQIASQNQHGFCFWAIERKADAALLGFCGLGRGGPDGTPVLDEMEIGWRLAKSAWGQGYAREAALACLTWAWANSETPRVVAWTVPANRPSWGLMLRLGMVHRPELDFDHPFFDQSHPLCRHIVYIIEHPID